MSKLFLVLAITCLTILLLCFIIIAWTMPDTPKVVARIALTAALVFIPNCIIYCIMEDRKDD